jgi:hypothetical protein
VGLESGRRCRTGNAGGARVSSGQIGSGGGADTLPFGFRPLDIVNLCVVHLDLKPHNPYKS